MDDTNNSKLAGVLICPKTKKPLTYDKSLDAFVDKEHNVIYDIKDGIPALLEEEKSTFKKKSQSNEDEL